MVRSIRHGSALRQLIWLTVPVLAVVAVIFLDPLIGARVPRTLLEPFGPGTTRLPVTLTILIFIGIAIFLLRLLSRTTDFATGAIVFLLVTSQLNGFGLGPLDTFDFALFAIFLCWATTLALDPTRPIRVGLLLSIAFFIGVLAVAHLPVMRPRNWIVGMIGVARISLIALLVVDLCRDETILRRVLRYFVIVAVISALIGIAQFFLALQKIWIFTLITPPESAFKPTPVGFVMRASGLCITAQHYASFLVYALPFALWNLSVRRTFRWIFGVIALLVGVIVSWNTGAVFSAALVIMVFPFLRWPERAAGLAVALVVVVSLAYFSGMLQLVFDSTFGDSGVAKGVDQRKTLFSLGIEQISANPFIGTGLHGFGAVDGNFWGRPVHNLFGQAAAELGAFGLLAAIALFAIPLMHLSMTLFTNDTYGLRRGSFLALLTALLLAQSEPNLQQSNLWLLLAFVQATILSTRARDGLGQLPVTGS